MQFPGVAHDTELNHPVGDSFCMLSSNCAGRARAHSPLVDVIVNASSPPLLFLNVPTAVQFPGVAHDTELKLAYGDSFCMSCPNSAGRAISHSPFVDVMVNASKPPLLFLKDPTVVQFPGVAHDTDRNPATSNWTPSANCAGRASPGSLLGGGDSRDEVMVNASEV